MTIFTTKLSTPGYWLITSTDDDATIIVEQPYEDMITSVCLCGCDCSTPDSVYGDVRSMQDIGLVPPHSLLSTWNLGRDCEIQHFLDGKPVLESHQNENLQKLTILRRKNANAEAGVSYWEEKLMKFDETRERSKASEIERQQEKIREAEEKIAVAKAKLAGLNAEFASKRQEIVQKLAERKKTLDECQTELAKIA